MCGRVFVCAYSCLTSFAMTLAHFLTYEDDCLSNGAYMTHFLFLSNTIILIDAGGQWSQNYWSYLKLSHLKRCSQNVNVGIIWDSKKLNYYLNLGGDIVEKTMMVWTGWLGWNWELRNLSLRPDTYHSMLDFSHGKYRMVAAIYPLLHPRFLCFWKWNSNENILFILPYTNSK